MDPKDKEKLVARYLRGAERERSYEEKQSLKRAKKARPGKGRRRPRQRDWDDADEAAGFEKISRRQSDPVSPAGPASAPPSASRTTGDHLTVIGLGPGRARVARGDEVFEASLSSALAERQQSAIAVGDRVLVEESEHAVRVVAVAPRSSTLSRPDPGDARRERLLAANVDAAIVVLSVVAPRLRPRLLDRLLVALWRGGVDPIFCINKVDLLPPEEDATLEAVLAPHRALGIPCHLVSIAEARGTDALRAEIRGRQVVVVGPSGVGKSSLLNLFDPEGRRAVNAPRESDGKGRHTTTSSSLTRLADGTRLIDTPGVRAFGLWQTTPADVARAFPDVAAAARGCRFRDCAHGPEPDCAVRAAVAPERLDTWRRLMESLE